MTFLSKGMGDGSTTGSFDRLDEKKRIVRVKQFKSLVTAFAFMAMVMSISFIEPICRVFLSAFESSGIFTRNLILSPGNLSDSPGTLYD